MSTTVTDIIRHGEPVGGRRYRGQIDDPLSEKGWTQMRAAVGDRCPWDRIISSPLARCAAFAEELSTRHRLPLSTDPRLQEIGFGCWEGLSAAEISREDPNALMRFYQDPLRNQPEGAEPLIDFHARVVAAWRAIQRQHAGEHLLLVSHAGVIRMILLQVLELPWSSLFRIHVANAAITRLQSDAAAGSEDNFTQLLFHGAANLPPD